MTYAQDSMGPTVRRLKVEPLGGPPPSASLNPAPTPEPTETTEAAPIRPGPKYYWPDPPPDQPSEPSALAVIVAAFSALGFALSARALMLLAVIGAFVLACMAMQTKGSTGLWVLVAFAVLVVFPLTWLEIRKGKS